MACDPGRQPFVLRPVPMAAASEKAFTVRLDDCSKAAPFRSASSTSGKGQGVPDIHSEMETSQKLGKRDHEGLSAQYKVMRPLDTGMAQPGAWKIIDNW